MYMIGEQLPQAVTNSGHTAVDTAVHLTESLHLREVLGSQQECSSHAFSIFMKKNRPIPFPTLHHQFLVTSTVRGKFRTDKSMVLLPEVVPVDDIVPKETLLVMKPEGMHIKFQKYKFHMHRIGDQKHYTLLSVFLWIQ